MWLAPDDTYRLLSGIKFRQESSIGNHRLSVLSPAVSPLKVESLDPGLSGTILDMNIHPIRFCTTPYIFQNPISKVSRGGIYKTEIEAEILQF